MSSAGHSRSIRLAALLVALIAPIALLAGCGSDKKDTAASTTAAHASSTGDDAPISADCPTQNTTAFAKTKFVLHSGLGFGAFHRYLYKPYKAGTFKKGADGRIKAFVKGGVAALFVKREIRLASEDVKANPTLCKTIAAPLAKIGNSVQSAFGKAKNGDDSGLDSVNSAITDVTHNSDSQGVNINEDDNPDITSVPR